MEVIDNAPTLTGFNTGIHKSDAMVKIYLLASFLMIVSNTHAQNSFVNVGDIDSVWRYYPSHVIQRSDGKYEMLSTYISANAPASEFLYTITADEGGKYLSKKITILDSLCSSPIIHFATNNSLNDFVFSGYAEGCNQAFVACLGVDGKQKWVRNKISTKRILISRKNEIVFSTQERLMKYDMEGNLMWQAVERLTPSSTDLLHIVELPDSGFLVPNYFVSSKLNFTRFSKTGEVLWTKQMSDTNDHFISAILLTSDNGLLFLNSKKVQDTTFTRYKIFLTKTDTALNTQWEIPTTYYGTYQSGLIELPSGQFMAVLAPVLNGSNIGASILKYTKEGTNINELFIGKEELSPIQNFPLFEIYYKSTQVLSDKGVLFCMSVGNYGVGRTYCLIKTDSLGNLTLPHNTGKEEVDFLRKIQIYPNPNNTNQLHINFPEQYSSTENIEVTFYNAMGQQVKFLKGNSQELKEVDIEQLINGCYVVEVRGANNTIYRTKLLRGGCL
ncbi:MAG: T9SS type A sorting domain-containing protein [Bacteroidia bacterium]|nr:T9SS type A sorting domain-containing protein [Bacteroidia bacterium]MBP9180446.1 T9SS type A sorting domain-containing protein [Bacteroidia bacterium]